MVRDILRLDLAVISVSKQLNPVEKTPIVWREQCRPEGFTVHVILLGDFCGLGDSK